MPWLRSRFWQRYIAQKRLRSRAGAGETAAFLLPVVLVAAGLMWYNYARFGSPFDFGANYNLTGNDMTKRGFNVVRIGPAVFTSLFDLPRLKSVFPFLQETEVTTNAVIRTISEPFVGGMLAATPFTWVLGLLALPQTRQSLRRRPGAAGFVWLAVAGMVIITGVDCEMAGVLYRYLMDYSPVLLLGAMLCWLLLESVLARRAAAESTVLLKNEEGLLPLAAGACVAVIGDFAETPRYQGAGSSAVNSIKVDTFLECLKESGLNSVGFATGFDRQGKPDAAKKAEAAALAAKADVVLLCLGLDEIKESEGLDRADMKLADNQIELLQAVQQANPNTVVVLSAGASLETPWLTHCKALVYGALGGQAGAGAMVDVLTGKVNPSGKLAETWANAYEHTPARDNFAGKGRTVQYREGLYVGYRYYQTAGVPVAFPFGYGLSYTNFAYSDLKADAHSVTLTVKNTGNRAGAEIVQLYIAKPDAKVFRPAQELKAFAKVQLAAGESKTVTLTLDDKAFRYWNTKTDSWEVEGGSYEIRVGASSADIRLTVVVEMAGTEAPNPYAGKSLPHYESGKVQSVPDAEWETLMGCLIPEDKVRIDRNMTLGELNHSRSPICWLVWLVLHTLLTASYKRGKPDLNVMFQYNMPLRALAKMTNGAISMGMVDGIVMEAKGFWIIGLCRVIVEAVKNVILNVQLEGRLRNS